MTFSSSALGNRLRVNKFWSSGAEPRHKLLKRWCRVRDKSSKSEKDLKLDVLSHRQRVVLIDRLKAFLLAHQLPGQLISYVKLSLCRELFKSFRTRLFLEVVLTPARPSSPGKEEHILMDSLFIIFFPLAFHFLVLFSLHFFCPRDSCLLSASYDFNVFN